MIQKIKFIFSLLMLIGATANAQQIVNYVFVGDKGITENVNEAHSFILVKKYGDRFQRLDYKINAPLVKERNFSDSSLSIMEGSFNLYDNNGGLVETGNYKKNLKHGSWYRFDSDNKLILEEKFENGVLINSKTDFTTQKDTIKETEFKDEREATFRKGNNDWIKYLRQNLQANVAINSLKGGTVLVGFTIDTTGTIDNIFLKRSIEYVLDEEAKRVIEKSPPWTPAFQNGTTVKAYRLQPISFAK